MLVALVFPQEPMAFGQPLILARAVVAAAPALSMLTATSNGMTVGWRLGRAFRLIYHLVAARFAFLEREPHKGCTTSDNITYGPDTKQTCTPLHCRDRWPWVLTPSALALRTKLHKRSNAFILNPNTNLQS
ncbi:hypothetical protein HGRIS_000995 [Hohenbuehelia grisea]|uniref:Secreted protein n=1 Tax=Hohenbuehelia grisea TaxID=104357 RepID=A0ABR3IQB7_9AGAR